MDNIEEIKKMGEAIRDLYLAGIITKRIAKNMFKKAHAMNKEYMEYWMDKGEDFIFIFNAVYHNLLKLEREI